MGGSSLFLHSEWTSHTGMPCTCMYDTPPPPCPAPRRSADELAGTRLTAFSYGSGLASTLYALHFSPDPAHLGRLVANASEVPAMLESRRVVPPAEFEQTLKLRQETHHLAPYKPVGSREALHPGTFFLTEVDDKHRRKYERVPPKPDKAGLPPLSNGHLSTKEGSV